MPMRPSTIAELQSRTQLASALQSAQEHNLEDFLQQCQEVTDTSRYVGGRLFLFHNAEHDKKRQEAGPGRYAVYYSVGHDNLYHNVVEHNASGMPSLKPVLKIMGFFLLREAADTPFIYRVGGYNSQNVPQGKFSRSSGKGRSASRRRT